MSAERADPPQDFGEQTLIDTWRREMARPRPILVPPPVPAPRVTTSDKWLLAAVVLVLAAVWPASATVGLAVLALAAFCLRMSKDTA